MHPELRPLFEPRVAFRLADGTPIEGSVFIGETEFLPVEVLLSDPPAYEEEFNGWLDEAWLPEQRERRARLLAL